MNSGNGSLWHWERCAFFTMQSTTGQKTEVVKGALGISGWTHCYCSNSSQSHCVCCFFCSLYVFAKLASRAEKEIVVVVASANDCTRANCGGYVFAGNIKINPECLEIHEVYYHLPWHSFKGERGVAHSASFLQGPIETFNKRFMLVCRTYVQGNIEDDEIRVSLHGLKCIICSDGDNVEASGRVNALDILE